jgi:hypothetical protein
MLDNNCIGELLITTNDNKHIYCYRGVSSSPTIVSSLFESFLLNYLFGYTDIDPKYEHGEYHNLTKEQKKQLKKEQEDEYKSRRAW